jgi:hypothetical protein
MIPRIHVDEICPLEGYEQLSVRVLANATDAEWRSWCDGNLGMPGCEACAKLNVPAVPRGKHKTEAAPAPASAPRYCPACTQARAQFGQALVTLYGPTLLGEDVSTPEAALALFDRDDALPSEIVIWLQLAPGTVRSRRTETLLGNLTRSSTSPS